MEARPGWARAAVETEERVRQELESSLNSSQEEYARLTAERDQWWKRLEEVAAKQPLRVLAQTNILEKRLRLLETSLQAKDGEIRGMLRQSRATDMAEACFAAEEFEKEQRRELRISRCY